MDPTPPRNSLTFWRRATSSEFYLPKDCHAERNREESAAILTMESKHPYPHLSRLRPPDSTPPRPAPPARPARPAPPAPPAPPNPAADSRRWSTMSIFGQAAKGGHGHKRERPRK